MRRAPPKIKSIGRERFMPSSDDRAVTSSTNYPFSINFQKQHYPKLFIHNNSRVARRVQPHFALFKIMYPGDMAVIAVGHAPYLLGKI
jgi:hypothetical protein